MFFDLKPNFVLGAQNPARDQFLTDLAHDVAKANSASDNPSRIQQGCSACCSWIARACANLNCCGGSLSPRLFGGFSRNNGPLLQVHDGDEGDGRSEGGYSLPGVHGQFGSGNGDVEDGHLGSSPGDGQHEYHRMPDSKKGGGLKKKINRILVFWLIFYKFHAKIHRFRQSFIILFFL